MAGFSTPTKNEIAEADEPVAVVYCQRANCPGSTGLRCIRTNVPICTKCAVLVKGVGYISPEAARAQQDKFFNAQTTDYIVAGAIAFTILLVLGFIFVLIFPGGFFALLIAFFAGSATGSLISQLVWNAIQRRRGRYTARVVVGAMLAATAIVFFFGFFSLTGLIFGIAATSAAAARFQVALRV